MSGAKARNRRYGFVTMVTRGRGAFPQGRSGIVRRRGPVGSENAGMSIEKTSENLVHRKPKVS